MPLPNVDADKATLCATPLSFFLRQHHLLTPTASEEETELVANEAKVTLRRARTPSPVNGAIARVGTLPDGAEIPLLVEYVDGEADTAATEASAHVALEAASSGLPLDTCVDLSDAVAAAVTKKGHKEKGRLSEKVNADIHSLAKETLPVRKKKDHPREVLQLLEDWYQGNMDTTGRAYLNADSKKKLVQVTGLKPKQISTWVSNRRNRRKAE